jgi:hypothetical protein
MTKNKQNLHNLQKMMKMIDQTNNNKKKSES